MRLDVKVSLDTGGYVMVVGENLTAEDVNEVFRLLAGHVIEGNQRPERGPEQT